MRAVRLGGAAAALLLFLRAPAARANAFDTLGYDTETGSLANSTVAYGRSLGVLHTNPALLPFVPSEVTAGLSFLAPHLHISLMPKPANTNVPISIYNSNLGAIAGLNDRSLPTAELPNQRGNTDVEGFQTNLGLGLATDLGIEHLRVGALLQLPLTGGTDSSVSTHYDDEREAGFSNRLSFMRFGQWERIVAATAGIGYEITPWFSLGFALQLAASATANLKVYVPDASVQDYSLSNMDTHISLSWRPVVGARIAPTPWSSIGITWRDESYFEVDGSDQVTLWNYHQSVPDKTILKTSTQTFPLVFGYEPMEVSVAIGARHGPVTAQLAGTWQRWSHYLDNHNERPQDAAAFPAVPANIGTKTFDTNPYQFSDVISLQSGASVQLNRHVEASVGGAWYPSPVPAQIGRTNFVDGTLVGITAGQRYAFTFLKRNVVLAVGVQVWHMLERTTYKDPSQIVDEFPDSARTLQSNKPMPEAAGLQTNNPGFPGYHSGGYLLAGSLSLAYLF